ncbi:hypothetical protein NDU88_001251 [Pleurodeles waltl]|uniref:Uncharacterized protein n=1 Tax=Pleurodeles waltl TaxID=8319 RepID=A0AAV7VYV6_PLEWA|nr:hypothetical protein NDU88_001251 [Pleurodeles waltl]
MRGTVARARLADRSWRCVAVVQSAADEGMGHCLPGVGRDPFVDPAEGAVAGGGDGADLSVHGECRVEDESQVAGVVGGRRSRSKGGGPPRVVPGGGGCPEDEDFCLVGVEFQAAISHPVGDCFHSFVEIGFGGGRVVGEGEDELGVVGVGDDVEVVTAGHLCEGGHVNVEQRWAQGGALGDAADDVVGF